jgi:hypothetical protein
VHGEDTSHAEDAIPPDLPCSSHPITVDELSTINKEPFRIVGKKFGIAGPDGEEWLLQIVGAAETIGRGRYFQVLMEGCVDCVEMSPLELREWLENSVVVDC